MRYIIDITQNQSDNIQKLIADGRYRDFNQFVCTAIDNQLHIETEEIGGHKIENLGSKINVYKPEELFEIDKSISIKTINIDVQGVAMPDFKNLSGSAYEIEEKDSWLWGQVNKIFPVKIGLRILLAMQGAEKNITLEEYSKKATHIAASYGTGIRLYEDRKKRPRDLRISAGLPSEDAFKSKLRYKGQFLAYVRKDGLMEGAMSFLKFINLYKDEESGQMCIYLTGAGVKFAQISNPVIDKGEFDKSLSKEEIAFYLEHIAENVIGEYQAIKWMLEKLEEGISDRTLINREMKKIFSQLWGGASDAVINTQRAGLMSRMYELKLYDKEKDANKVAYLINDAGKELLRQ